MIKIYSPDNEFDLIFIKSILFGERIEFYVHNDHFGSLKIGPPIELFNRKTIFVSLKDEARAKELISFYIENSYNEGHNIREKDKLKIKLRVIFEFLLFKWYVPQRIIDNR